MSMRSRSTLFLIEQLIVIAVFAICAATCARILTTAYFNARDSKDLSNAILAAENGAEVFKATGGVPGRVAQMLGGVTAMVDGAPAAIIYYDKQWTVCGEDDAFYRLLLVVGGPESGLPQLLSGDLTVEKLTGEEILAFPVMVRRGTG